MINEKNIEKIPDLSDMLKDLFCQISNGIITREQLKLFLQHKNPFDVNTEKDISANKRSIKTGGKKTGTVILKNDKAITVFENETCYSTSGAGEEGNRRDAISKKQYKLMIESMQKEKEANTAFLPISSVMLERFFSANGIATKPTVRKWLIVALAKGDMEIKLGENRKILYELKEEKK